MLDLNDDVDQYCRLWWEEELFHYGFSHHSTSGY